MSENNVEVIVSPPSPDVEVVVSPPLPEITVVVSPLGVPGRDGVDSVGDALQQHIDSPNPHPVYDDGVSFVSFYNNAKV